MKSPDDPENRFSEESLKKYAAILAHQRQRRWKRSTLSARSALEMRPWIVALVNSPRELSIPYSAFPGCSARTVYVKFLDALRWYIEMDPMITQEERNAIAYLKQIIIIEQGEESLNIFPASVGGEINARKPGRPVKALEEATATAEKVRAKTSVAWKELFLEWMNAGDPSQPFHQKKLVLGPVDIDWLKNICEQNDWPYKATMTEVWVSKEG